MTDIRKTTSFTLSEPVVIEGRTIDSLSFRRIKGKDIKAVDKLDSQIEAAAFLICTLSGNPPELFDEMDAADIEGASKIVEGFMKRKVGQASLK